MELSGLRTIFLSNQNKFERVKSFQISTLPLFAILHVSVSLVIVIVLFLL